jgi:hypothetical protein
LSLACLRSLMVRGPLATRGRVLGDGTSTPPGDARTLLEDPTPHLRLRHAGIPLRRFSSPRLASSHHLGRSAIDPGCSSQARGASLDGGVWRRIHRLPKQNMVLVQASP